MAPKRRKRGKKNTTKTAADIDNEPEYLGTVEPSLVELEHPEQEEHVTQQIEESTHPEQEEHVSQQIEEETQLGRASATDGVFEEEPEGEIELSEDAENPNKPKRKRHRGPTLMKNIAKDPNIRERVDFTAFGEPCGPGSVKLSSYLGPLVREHVPVTVDGWLKISEEVKIVMWRTIQARFELDHEYQKKAIFKQMGCLWRSSKSRLVTKINNAKTNQQRMNLRPINVSPTDWRKFVKVKTSQSFKVVSDSYKKRRAKQIAHTCSRKGIVRLTEQMKQESEDPSDVDRLKVWMKSRTRKDGTPVNNIAAEKIKKAAELIAMGATSTETKPGEDALGQLLGPDNPGRLRAMGRSMSKTKLACFQVKQTCLADMEKNQVRLQQTVNKLQAEVNRLKKEKQEPEVGENSAPRSVNKRAQPKCVLIDWDGSDEHVAEGRIIHSSPEDLVNGALLGPTDVKVLIDTVFKQEAFLWRPTVNMCRAKDAVGEMIAWSVNHYVLLEQLVQREDIAHTGSNSLNKCKLLDCHSKDDVVVAEGRWHTTEEEELVNGVPLGPNAFKVFVDEIIQPGSFIWRPMKGITYLDDCFKSYVSWPAAKVVLEDITDARGQKSPVDIAQGTGGKGAAKGYTSPTKKSVASKGQKAAAKGSTSHTEKSLASRGPKASGKGSVSRVEKSPHAKGTQGSPLRKSQRKNTPNAVFKENQKINLLDIANGKRIVAQALWISNDPDQNIHCVRLGENGVKVQVQAVDVPDAAVWKPSSAIECMDDALGTYIAWPEDKVVVA